MLVDEVGEGAEGKITSYDGYMVGGLRMVHPEEGGKRSCFMFRK